jgi:hypothetical protein
MGPKTKINDGGNTIEKDTMKKTTKKKIIPVVSDSSQSSPSPEEPSSPVDSHQALSLSSRFRNSQKNSLNKQEVENMRGNLKNSLSKHQHIIIGLNITNVRFQRETGKPKTQTLGKISKISSS